MGVSDTYGQQIIVKQNFVQFKKKILYTKLDNNSFGKNFIKTKNWNKIKIIHNKNTHILKLKKSISKHKTRDNLNNGVSAFLSFYRVTRE